jgi:(2R)-sulfolactate sulfo-lyase subunit alpha
LRVTFLVHEEADNVGVAVEDIPEGDGASSGRFRDQSGELLITVTEPILLGHKLALRDIANGDEVVEYGVAIGRATQDIKQGQCVHTHNLKGQRWS